MQNFTKYQLINRHVAEFISVDKEIKCSKLFLDKIKELILVLAPWWAYQ